MCVYFKTQYVLLITKLKIQKKKKKKNLKTSLEKHQYHLGLLLWVIGEMSLGPIAYDTTFIAVWVWASMLVNAPTKLDSASIFFFPQFAIEWKLQSIWIFYLENRVNKDFPNPPFSKGIIVLKKLKSVPELYYIDYIIYEQI